jgi:hypothetical protein
MKDKLEAAVGRTIGDFCKSGFTKSTDNHCAHFVSHMLGYAFGFTCRQMTGKGSNTATIRVHELFPQCPALSAFGAGVADGIVFVTDASNVDLVKRTMRNVPQKHVGILCDGNVYHYSNTIDEVVRQTPSEFLTRFRGVYGAGAALFWGSFPGSQLPEAAPAGPAPLSTTGPVQWRVVEHSNGNHEYFARVNGEAELFVASRVRYQQRRGLYQNASQQNGAVYRASDYTATHGHAAHLAELIGRNESKNHFNCLNTYDRAAFTFGFFQLAAHTPKDNLVLFFRRALEIPEFAALYPDLKLVDGRLHKVDENGSTDLELEVPRSPGSTELNLRNFMAYLNPDGSEVDDPEIRNAAKLVWLAARSDACRRLQVSVSLGITMNKLRRVYDPWYGLDGKSDTVCFIIADIHHQGRATRTQVRTALGSGNPVAALLKLGKEDYAERCATLADSVNTMRAAGILDTHVFSRASGLFAPRGQPIPF